MNFICNLDYLINTFFRCYIKIEFKKYEIIICNYLKYISLLKIEFINLVNSKNNH